MTEHEATGVISLGSKLIGSLPAQFLMLCVLNMVFLGGLLWFLDKREEARERVLGPIVERCLQEVPLDAVEKLLGHRGD